MLLRLSFAVFFAMLCVSTYASEGYADASAAAAAPRDAHEVVFGRADVIEPPVFTAHAYCALAETWSNRSISHEPSRHELG